jgi:hypothetical protein
MKLWHVLLYAGLVVCVIVLLIAGTLSFIAAVASALVMSMMIWTMVWPDRRNDKGTPRGRRADRGA